MFQSFGTLLPSLFPFTNLFSWMAGEKEEDEAEDDDDDTSDEGADREQDDGDDSDDDDEDDEENDDETDDDEEDSDEEDSADDGDDDDLDEELDAEENTRRKADSIVSKANARSDASLNQLVKVMVKYPDSAESTIADLRKEQPELAARLAKLYESNNGKALTDALKDAPDSVKSVLSKLVEEVGTLKSQKENDQIAAERRTYKDWEKGAHPYLNPKSEIAKTPIGKKLIKEFHAAINRMPDSEPMSEELLEDALAIAKRRTGWKNSRVSEQAKQQAKEQAQKARSGAIGSGKGKKGKGEGESPKPSRVTALFGSNDPERQKRVDEVKRKKGFIK